MSRMIRGLRARAKPRSLEVLWALVLVLLPITSFPLLSKLGGSPIVSPASAIPLGLLALVWFVPYLYRKGHLPTEISPLAFFLLFAVVSSAAALFLTILPYKDQTPLGREIRALVTLSVGIAFYTFTSVYVSTEMNLARSVKLINIGGALLLVWAMAQGVVIHFYDGEYPGFMITVHDLLSLRDPLDERVTGLAYEPSWLANMLNLLYFPLWLGMLASGRSIYKRRIWIIPIEAFLMIVGVAAIFLGRVRLGLVSLLAMTGFLAFWLALKATRLIQRRLASRSSFKNPALGKAWSFVASALSILVILGLFVSLAVAAVMIAAELDWRLRNLIEGDVLASIQKNPGYLFTYRFARALRFAERTAYWSASLEIFKEYPILGVGLGNSGFFFTEHMPTFGWRAPEIVQAIRPDTNIFPNPKNLWIRILSETGTVGFTFVVVWLSLVLLRSWQLARRQDGLLQTMGLVGFLSLIAVVSEGFSVDSFALPYMWISLGLVTAAALMSPADRSGSPGS